MKMKETLQHSHCLNSCFRELQQSIAREPSAPSFNVPAYQSTPAAPAAGGPTPAPRTVFVSSHSQSQTLSRCESDGCILICLSSLSLSLTPAASATPAAAPGKATAPGQASSTKLQPSGSVHHSHQRTTHWPSHWPSHQQPTTCGPTFPGPGTTLPHLSGLSRVSFPSQHPDF